VFGNVNMEDKIKNFTPSWFSINMGTGIIAILLYNFPFLHNYLKYLSLGVFSLNVIMFIVFSVVTIIRYVKFPQIFNLMLSHLQQSLFIGTLPMGLTTITNYLIMLNYTNLAHTLWWIEFVLTIVSCILLPYYIIVIHEHRLETINATLLLPIVPAIVTAASGGLLAQNLYLNDNIFFAKFILFISFALIGLGILLALSIITIYLYRLIIHSLPQREIIISVFLPLGPLGQGSYAFMQLGKSFNLIVNNSCIDGLGNSVYSFTFLIAILLWGYGAWYLTIALLSLFVTYSAGIPFNMGWWGLIFPMGVYTAATLSIATTINSFPLKIIASVSVCLLFMLWIVVGYKTCSDILSGKLFYAPCLTPYQRNSASDS
jgi:C4-dicarboxylate transporter/malic acid transport protein